MSDKRRLWSTLGVLSVGGVVGLVLPDALAHALELPYVWSIGLVATLRIGFVCGILCWLRGGRGLAETFGSWFPAVSVWQMAIVVGCMSAAAASIMWLAGAYVRRGPSVKLLIPMALFVPMAEEVVYRGMLLGVLRREVRLGSTVSVVISAIAFGAAHCEWQGPEWSTEALRMGIYTGIGIGLGGLCVLGDGGLWSCTVFHIGVNAMAAVFMANARIAVGQVEAIVQCAVLLSLGVACLVIWTIRPRMRGASKWRIG